MDSKHFALHGKLDKYGTLHKKEKQVVLFRNYDGFAVPVPILRQIKAVELEYQGVVYVASVDDFRAHAIPHIYEYKDTYGLTRKEQQYILPRSYWKQEKQTSLFEDSHIDTKAQKSQKAKRELA